MIVFPQFRNTCISALFYLLPFIYLLLLTLFFTYCVLSSWIRVCKNVCVCVCVCVGGLLF